MPNKSSRTKKAGLVFPVDRIEKIAKNRFPKKHFKKHTTVRLAGVIEFAIGQLLEKAAEKVVSGKYITPEHIAKVVTDDKDKMYNFFTPNITGIK